MVSVTKRKNYRGFSLVELIVVLVIMALLATALVPTMIGYIRQSRERDAVEQAERCVHTAQTIISTVYAADDCVYHSSFAEDDLVFLGADNKFGLPSDEEAFALEVEKTAEVDGEVTDISVDSNLRICHLVFTSNRNRSIIEYDGNSYTYQQAS